MPLSRASKTNESEGGGEEELRVVHTLTQVDYRPLVFTRF